MPHERSIIIISLLFLVSCSNNSSFKEEGMKEVNGTGLYYQVVGQGEPILVIHGGPGLNHKYLSPHLAKLSGQFQMVFYDQRGCGRSSLQADPASFTLDNFVKDIDALRKSFTIEKINLMAHSWGGLLAMWYAIKYPENVRSLILINSVGASSALNKEANRILAKAFTREDSLERADILHSEKFLDMDPGTIERLMKIGFKHQFHNPSLIDSLDLSLNPNYARTSQLLQNLAYDLEEYDFYSDLSSIKCPTLLVYGNDDPLTELAGTRIHATIENSTLVILENSGHFPFIEKPEKFMDTIIQFMDTIQ